MAPARASQTGTVAPDQILSVSIITRRKKPLHLHELGGRVLSHEEFVEEYAADPADFDSLRQFAHEYGLTVDESASSVARRTLVVRGPASAIEEAFGVKLKTFQHLKTQAHFHSFEGEVCVPEQYAPQIEAVLGLDTRPVAKAHFRRRSGGIVAAAATEKSFTPPQVAALYNFPTDLTGAGQTIAILELGGGYESSDITSYFDGLGLKPPTVVAVSVDGATNVPGGDPNGADGEVALDIQVAGAVASGAKIAVYFTPNTDQGFLDAITTAVHDQTNKPSVLSISWGGPEDQWAASSLTALDNACASAGALGVTITVASGDDGSADGESSGNHVDFPASSPHVLACGGTRLEGSGSTVSSEVVWDDLSSGGGAGGGGVSGAFDLPTWQQSADVSAATNGGAKRGVPDVAGDAAPETGYNVLVDGQSSVVGGTSAVAPLWAGLLALVNEQRVKAGQATAGFVNPTLYANPKAFRDITSGNNGGYSARAGWDACTGLGSPHGAEILSLLAGTGATTGGSGSTGSGAGSGSGSGSGGSGSGSGGSGSGDGSGKEPVHKKHHRKHHRHGNEGDGGEVTTVIES